MNKKLQKFMNIAIPILLLSGTVSIYFFAKGYRFDFTNGEIEKTGVISVETNPRRADIYIDGKLVGTSPRTFGGISEGDHTVRIEKDGYHIWTIDVPVLIEQLVPLEVELFLEDPIIETLFATSPIESCEEILNATEEDETNESAITESELLGFYSDRESNTALFAHLTNSMSCTSQPESSESNRVIEIWAYPVKRQFWNLSPEAEIIAEFDIELLGDAFLGGSPEIDLLVSPDGNTALATISLELTNHFFIINTKSYNTAPTEIDDLSRNAGTQPEWSNDSRHIILEKNSELRSLNVGTQSLSVITEISEVEESPFYWTSNQSGQLFFPSYTENLVSIVRSNPNGTNQESIIQFPMKETSRTLSEGNLGTELSDTPPLVSIDPEELLTVSEIYLTPVEDTILFFSDNAISLYSLNADTVTSFPANSPQFLSFSPNERSFAYLDNENPTLNELWYNPEETDPIHTLGTRALIELSADYSYTSLVWHPEGTAILLNRTPLSDDEETADSEEKTSYVIAIDTETSATYSLSNPLAFSRISVDSSGSLFITQCAYTEICLTHFQD